MQPANAPSTATATARSCAPKFDFSPTSPILDLRHKKAPHGSNQPGAQTQGDTGALVARV